MEHSTNNCKREVVVDVLQGDHNVSNKSSKSILGDLQQYGFSDDINMRANVIYSKMNNHTRRANKRTLLLFFCVDNAYKELGIDVNPSELGKKFGLKAGQMAKTRSMFSELKTGYKTMRRTISVYQYIPDYCDALGLENYTDDIIKLTESVLAKDINLQQNVQQTTAAGIIRYFLIINGIELTDKHALATVTDRSDTTIDSMYKRICEVDNR